MALEEFRYPQWSIGHSVSQVSNVGMLKSSTSQCVDTIEATQKITFDTYKLSRLNNILIAVFELLFQIDGPFD